MAKLRKVVGHVSATNQAAGPKHGWFARLKPSAIQSVKGVLRFAVELSPPLAIALAQELLGPSEPIEGVDSLLENFLAVSTLHCLSVLCLPPGEFVCVIIYMAADNREDDRAVVHRKSLVENLSQQNSISMIGI
jgi:hypothetical protein